MNTVWGYARCSTDETRQDIGRQKQELLKLGVADENHIYYEYASGTDKDRAELKRLFESVQPGDTIASTEVSRLTRSTKHLCEILEAVKEKRLRLIIGSFIVDCRSDEIDPMTKGMLMMWGVFSEMERDIISERVKSGISNARSKGKRIGRPEFSPDDIPKSFYRLYKLYISGDLTVTDIARTMECSRTTVYKYIAAITK